MDIHGDLWVMCLWNVGSFQYYATVPKLRNHNTEYMQSWKHNYLCYIKFMCYSCDPLNYLRNMIEKSLAKS
jgi:hypothetical protein